MSVQVHSNAKTPIQIPKDCMPLIFSGLTNQEIAKTTSVSKDWQRACEYTFKVDALRWDEAGVTISPKLLKEQGIHSTAELEERISQFLSRITITKEGMLVADFSFDPGCELALCVKNEHARFGREKEVQGLVVASKNKNRSLNPKASVQEKNGESSEISIVEPVDVHFAGREIVITAKGRVPSYDLPLSLMQEMQTKFETNISKILIPFLKNTISLSLIDKVERIVPMFQGIYKRLNMSRNEVERNNLLILQKTFELVERYKGAIQEIGETMEEPVRVLMAAPGVGLAVSDFLNVCEEVLKTLLSKESITSEDIEDALNANNIEQHGLMISQALPDALWNQMKTTGLDLSNRFATTLKQVNEELQKTWESKGPFEKKVEALVKNKIEEMKRAAFLQRFKNTPRTILETVRSLPSLPSRFMALPREKKLTVFMRSLIFLYLAKQTYDDLAIHKELPYGQSMWYPACDAGEPLANQCLNPFNY